MILLVPSIVMVFEARLAANDSDEDVASILHVSLGIHGLLPLLLHELLSLLLAHGREDTLTSEVLVRISDQLLADHDVGRLLHAFLHLVVLNLLEQGLARNILGLDRMHRLTDSSRCVLNRERINVEWVEFIELSRLGTDG